MSVHKLKAVLIASSILGFAVVAACSKSGSQGATTSGSGSGSGSASGSQSSSTDPFKNNPNIYEFDSSMKQSDIQSTVDAIYKQQYGAQFSTTRIALLFKPGTYGTTSNPLDIKVGYYTQVLGLGQSPDDTIIIGTIRTENDTGDNATNNFWRSIENISIIPIIEANKPTTICTDQTKTPHQDCISTTPVNHNAWAVSQAAPLRRVHIKGDLDLFVGMPSIYDSKGNPIFLGGGWTSGGFMANSIVDGTVESGSQQQWISRHSTWNNWKRSNWFTVFLGTTGTIPTDPKLGSVGVFSDSDLNPPQFSEKPFLDFNKGQFEVVIPALKQNNQGAEDWQKEYANAKKIVISPDYIYVASPSANETQNIQNALTNGKSIIFTPGIYQITNTLKVTNSNTTIYGLGFATLIPAQNFTGPLITVVDAVDGVKIEGLILDAGSISSNTLLQIGDVKSPSHTNNPSILYDVFCRVGGETDGTAKNCITINSNDVIGDDVWIWRADHDNNGQVLWNQNLSDTGLIVNGDNVTMYGLAVEHFQKIQTIWNGENGTTYFYQSEIPYHMPKDFTGFASYEVGANVKVHHAYGLGVYMFLNDNSNAVIPSAIKTPNASGIQFTDMDVVIGGNNVTSSYIKNIINSAPTTGYKLNIPTYLPSWTGPGTN